jgi:predicted  nucleic acid-binding Zn-ribbon protein
MADGANEGVFTVKEWLTRIDAKQDRLDEKIDKLSEGMDRKADAHDVRSLEQRMTIVEQQNAARLTAYNNLERRVDNTSERLTGENGLDKTKADRADVAALWRVLVGALSGSSIAILAWALTLFVR